MLLISTEILVTIISHISRNETFTSYTISAYQTQSYVSAFAYCLNLSFLLYGAQYKLFKFHYYKWFKIIEYILLLVQISGVLFSGGRGGFVLLVSSSVILLWVKSKDKNFRINKVFIIILFLTVVGLLTVPKIVKVDLFSESTQRIFSYISPRGLDLTETSDRDVLYYKAFELIKERPISGYGLFGFYDYIFYPHNIFLEILLNGGIIFLLFAIIIVLIFFTKLKLIIHHAPSNLVILSVVIFPMTELMFSGTYMVTPLFWFAISYVFCYSIYN
jgi:O-antigen ligase